MYKDDYNKIVREYFDINHTETRKVLISMNEADETQVLTKLTGRLYDNIVNKVDDIDYGDIPKSKGDITKLENYERLTDCLAILRSLLLEYKQKTTSVDTIIDALDNVAKRKDLFQRAFTFNIELPIVMYSTICLSIVSATSFLIASCIEFIKSPNQEDFDLVLDKTGLIKTKDNLLFRNLEKFNKSCSSGQLDECINYVIKNKVKNLTGVDDLALVVGAIAIAGLLLNIIPILRELTFFFYYSRTRMSDYFDIQADLLNMNAYNVQINQTLDKKERDSISKKQLGISSMFKKISNALAIKSKESEKKAIKDMTVDNKKYKIDELVDSIPDSATSALF